MQLEQGQEVMTPEGRGRVAYVVMRAPNYFEAQSVSVILDAKRNYITYSGTKFPADQVTPCSND